MLGTIRHTASNPVTHGHHPTLTHGPGSWAEVCSSLSLTEVKPTDHQTRQCRAEGLSLYPSALHNLEPERGSHCEVACPCHSQRLPRHAFQGLTGISCHPDTNRKHKALSVTPSYWLGSSLDYLGRRDLSQRHRTALLGFLPCTSMQSDRVHHRTGE
jgi:hypothetical protein